jgi:hypothetical protein
LKSFVAHCMASDFQKKAWKLQLHKLLNVVKKSNLLLCLHHFKIVNSQARNQSPKWYSSGTREICTWKPDDYLQTVN